MISILSPLPEDWLRLKALRLEALRTDPSAFAVRLEDALRKPDEEWRKYARRGANADNVMFVAVEQGEMVGMVGAFLAAPQRWTMMGMYVRPSIRRRGVANQLVERLIAELRACNARDMDLLVNPQQVPAMSLYRKLGFDKIAELPNQIMGDGMPHTEYRLRLAL